MSRRTSAPPRVSVVLPIRNEAKHIEATLAHLIDQDYPADDMEILVVDGRSDDETRDRVRRFAEPIDAPAIRLLDNPKRTVPPALNIGIREAHGDYIVRMDGHTVPDRTYVRRCVEALDRTGAANVGGRITPRGTSAFGRAVALAQTHKLGAGDAKFHFADEAQEVDTVYMGAFRRSSFVRSGLFDESMTRNQDYELNVRLRQAGEVVYLDPSIQSTYEPRSTPWALWRQYFQYGWWRVETLRRHPGSLRLRQAIPPVFVAAVVLAGLAAVYLPAARWPFAVLVAPYVAAVALATIGVGREGRARGRVLVAFPLAMWILHFAWGSGFLLSLVTSGRVPYRAQPPQVPSAPTSGPESR